MASSAMLDFMFLRSQPIAVTLLVLVGGYGISFLLKAYRERRLTKGLPRPPFNPIFGNLIALGKVASALPPSIHPHCYARFIRKRYNLPAVFYLDLWPVGLNMLIITDPDAASQVTVQHSLDKHRRLAEILSPVAGRDNMVSSNGAQWKMLRSTFNPGFSSAHLMTLVPGMVDEGEIFAKILSEHAAQKDVFVLEEAATRVTVDIIGRVVMDHRLNSQTSENELVNAFRTQIRWLLVVDDINPFKIFNPIRPFVLRYYERKMNNYVGRVLEDRFAARKRGQKTASTRGRRPVIDIALDTYQEAEETNGPQAMNATFKAFAIDQIKTFILAGHDTTSSTICYIYHLLSKHPEALRTVRAEYDEVFGTDTKQAAQLIRENPHLLNKLPYSLAIIKEVLRLFPAASSVRKGERGFFVNHEGEQYPTEGFMVWIVNQAIHRREDLWKDADSFTPERWLAKDGDSVAGVKGAWRPFEQGPRNCIGQELALLETKIIMALTLREFNVRAAYDEDGPKAGVNDIGGERAFQILIATAKPTEGMPARVTTR